VTAGPFNDGNPSEIERGFRHFKLAYRGVTKFGFGQELRLIVVYERKQPVATSSPFLSGFFREFLAAAFLYHAYL